MPFNLIRGKKSLTKVILINLEIFQSLKSIYWMLSLLKLGTVQQIFSSRFRGTGIAFITVYILGSVLHTVTHHKYDSWNVIFPKNLWKTPFSFKFSINNNTSIVHTGLLCELLFMNLSREEPVDQTDCLLLRKDFSFKATFMTPKSITFPSL